jgi:alcohol dehydrogenase
MRAAVFAGHGEPLQIREVDTPESDDDGIVVETEACGVCRSDWHAWQGDPAWADREFQEGHVFGHEPAGEVVSVGDDVEAFDAGDLVAVPFNLADGTCKLCHAGHANVCDDGIPLGLTPEAPGAFAQQFHVPRADYNVVDLPDGVRPADMAGLGCRFITAFHALVNRAAVDPGDWLAVHGCGGVGLSAVHIGDALGANVVAVDLFDEKLSLAVELGASASVNAEDVTDVPAAVRDITDGGADVSVDALGIAETCRNSLASLGPLGEHVQIGLTTTEQGGEVPVPVDRIVRNEITVVGSIGMPPVHYGEIFNMIDSGTLAPEAVVSETIALDEVPETLEAMSAFDTVGIPVVTDF